MKLHNNFMIAVAFLCISTLGCSKNNPIQFSKVNSQYDRSYVSSEAAEETKQENSLRELTLLELYLFEHIDREYMLAWFFDDVKLYRAKLFTIKDEIRQKKPLSAHDRDRVLLLEAGINEAIRIFNEQNVLVRSREVITAAVHAYREPDKEKEFKYTLEKARQQGLPARAISNNILGFFGSFTRYGFQIETVNFLDRNIQN